MGFYLLGIDVGTTHCKAGLFDQHGRLVQIASLLTRSQKSPKVFFYYDPLELWASLAAAIRKIIQGIPTAQIVAVGIASMAETGMLVDRLSGAPRSDLQVRAAFVGLDATHSRADLTRAVLEGMAYEIEFIRRVAECVIGNPVEQITVSGGGTRNPHWMQIKADVSGCRLEALDMPEATLLGAALIAGVGCGVYPDTQTASATANRLERTVYLPDAARHKQYTHFYEIGFLTLQSPLRVIAQELTRMEIRGD